MKKPEMATEQKPARPVTPYVHFKDLPPKDTGPPYEGRLEGARHVKKYVIAQAVFGGLSILSGITTVFMASANPNFPFVVGQDIWNGALCVASGGLAFRVNHVTRQISDLPSRLRYLFLLYGLVSYLGVAASLVALGLSMYAIIVCADSDSPDRDTCQPRREPNLAMAITDIVFELILLLLSFLASLQFCRYRSAFGLDLPCEGSPESRTRRWQNSKWEKRRKKISEDIIKANEYVLPSGGSLNGWRSFRATSKDVLTGPAFYQSKKACYTYS